MKHAVVTDSKGKLGQELLELSNSKLTVHPMTSFLDGTATPDYFIHNGASGKPMSDIDRHPDKGIANNIISTAKLAEGCLWDNVKLIYISTDYVYGNVHGAKETDPVNPINKYAWSKLGGECAVRLLPDHLILRCALCDIPFRHEIAFDDVYRSSITHADAAKLIVSHLLDEVGIINVGGEVKSVYEFVQQYDPDVEGGLCNVPEARTVTMNIDKLKYIIMRGELDE